MACLPAFDKAREPLGVSGAVGVAEDKQLACRAGNAQVAGGVGKETLRRLNELNFGKAGCYGGGAFLLGAVDRDDFEVAERLTAQSFKSGGQCIAGEIAR